MYSQLGERGRQKLLHVLGQLLAGLHTQMMTGSILCLPSVNGVMERTCNEASHFGQHRDHLLRQMLVDVHPEEPCVEHAA
eukprot:56831-Eustigmatos_ZCMA.PRE.1